MESFSLNIDPTKLYQAFNRAEQAVSQELRIAMSKGMREVARDAKTIHKFKASSKDQAERAIRYEVRQSGLEGRVFLDEQIAPYVKYLHEGTETHYVFPKTRKALFWVQGGKKMFSKGHEVQGIQKDQFIYRALARKKKEVIQFINEAVKKAFNIAGFK